MNDYIAIGLAVVAIAWSVAMWDLCRRWIQDRSAAALHRRQDEYEEKLGREMKELRGLCNVQKLAIENLAKEVDENLAQLRAQQVGILSGMQQRQRVFK